MRASPSRLQLCKRTSQLWPLVAPSRLGTLSSPELICARGQSGEAALQENLSALTSRGSVSARYTAFILPAPSHLPFWDYRYLAELTCTSLSLSVPYWTYMYLAELTCTFLSLPVHCWTHLYLAKLTCTLLSLTEPFRYTEQVSAYLSLVGRPSPKPVAKPPVMSWRSLLLVSQKVDCNGNGEFTCLFWLMLEVSSLYLPWIWMIFSYPDYGGFPFWQVAI